MAAAPVPANHITNPVRHVETHANVPEQVGVLGATLMWIQLPGSNVGRATLTWVGMLAWDRATLTWVLGRHVSVGRVAR